MKKQLVILILILSLVSVTMIGCANNTEDTRQYIDTMGVVFTVETDDIINELYAFPVVIDGTDVLEQDMGPDLIKNTSSVRRVGSYGITVEMQRSSYNVMARDRSQGIYIFTDVPLTNVCEAVLTYDRSVGANPILTVYHKNGGVDVIEGQFIPPHDAPDHAHLPLRRNSTVRFSIKNDTNHDISFISMREADNPGIGEVELFIGTLAAQKTERVQHRIFRDDEEITEWLLYIETSTGETILFNGVFNPWETNEVSIYMDGNTIAFTATK